MANVINIQGIDENGDARIVRVDTSGKLSLAADVDIDTTGLATSEKQDTAQTSLTAITGHVDGVETLLTTIDGRVDGIEGLLTTIDGRVDGIEALLTTLNGYLAPSGSGDLVAVALSATTSTALADHACRRVTIKNPIGAGTTLYIDFGTASTASYPIDPGDSLTLFVSNTNLLSAYSTPGHTYVYIYEV